MEEEEKKVTEEKKAEEEAVEGKKGAPVKETPEEEKKPEDSKEEQPPAPQEIVLRVFMHCEGCARKVRRCLQDFEGVEDVIADCKTRKVVVKGERADPLNVLERVQRKCRRKVEVIYPVPSEQKQNEVLKPADGDQKREPPVITVVLGVYMHCGACAEETKRHIKRMKGVESAEPDLNSSQVKVKGIFEPQELIDYIYKRTGKHGMIIKVEPEKKDNEEAKETEEVKEKMKEKEGEIETNKDEEAKEEGGSDTAAKAASSGGEPETKPEAEDPKLKLRRNEFFQYYPESYPMYPPTFVEEMNAYPPQIFSDENPNACAVM